jgi:cytochrome c556
MIRLPVHVVLVLVVVIAFWTDYEASAAAGAKRARPPKFSQGVTDAFFSDARQKLVGSRPDRPSGPALGPRAESADGPAARPIDAKSANDGWSKLISAEVVEDEIKSQQLKLAEVVKSSTRFKAGDYQRARLHLSVLAVMFGIAADFGEKMRWQREAPAMRDKLARAGSNCKVATDASYKEAKTRAEELENLVRGSSTPSGNPPPEASWATLADRPQLMKRLEQAQQAGLAPGTANAREFSRSASKLSHEAQLIAALAEVIQREGYEFADDEAYTEHARAMQAQALSVRDAAEQKDYDQARRAVGELGKACTNCHEGFRG